MSAGAVFKFHGRFNSLNEIKAHIHAGAEYPPQIGDSAQYVEADGSLAEASFTSSGWIERSRFNPDGSTSFAGSLKVAGGAVAENVTPLGALLPKTRAALTRASTGGGALRAVFLGDSTVVAFGAVGGAQDIAGNAQRSIGKHMLTWAPEAFRVEARRDSFFGSGSILYSDATKAQYDSRITQSGSGISYDSLRSIGDGAIKFSEINDALTFTPENPFTSVSIRSLGGVSGWGSVDVAIGGVSVGTISAAAGTGYNLTTYTGSWAAGTPITITNLGIGNRLFDLLSIECEDSAFRGISILEMGWSGCTIADLTSDDYVWQHLPALVAQAPDLVVLKCTTNDSGSPAQSSIATPAAAYAASLKVLRDALPNADVVFADCFPSAYADLNPGALDGFKQAAIDLGLPIIDLREIYGDDSTAAIATGLAIGPVHPGEVAYALYARTVSERIAEGLGAPLIGTIGRLPFSLDARGSGVVPGALSVGGGVGTGAIAPSAASLTLASALAGSIPAAGTRLILSDVPDADIRSSGTKWMGFFGTLTSTQFAALQAHNAAISARSWCMVPNPAVSTGLSRLERGVAMTWAPPKGEPVAQRWRTRAASLASVTPGVTTLSEVWGAGGNLSPVIPDYMLPDGLVLSVSGFVRAKNAAGVAGCILGITISGSTPTGAGVHNYPLSTSVTPPSTGLGIDIRGAGKLFIDGSAFRCSEGQYFNAGDLNANTAGVVVAGANRVYIMAKPSGIADTIVVEGYSIVSDGNM